MCFYMQNNITGRATEQRQRAREPESQRRRSRETERQRDRETDRETETKRQKDRESTSFLEGDLFAQPAGLIYLALWKFIQLAI